MRRSKSICWSCGSLLDFAGRNIPPRPVDPVITANEEAHTIDLTMGTQGWKLNGNALYALAEDAVEQETYGDVTLELDPVEPTEVDITDAYRELAGDPVEPYYYGGQVLEGENGYTLDWEKAIGDILASSYGEELSIPMTAIPPSILPKRSRPFCSGTSSPHTARPMWRIPIEPIICPWPVRPSTER